MSATRNMVSSKIRIALEMLGGISSKAIAALVACIGLGIVGIYYATTIDDDLPLSDGGSLALIIGVIITLFVGVGLMALIFFSSRSGFDEPPTIQSDGRVETGGRSTPSDPR